MDSLPVCCELDAWHGRGGSAVDDDALMIKFTTIDGNPLSVEYALSSVFYRAGGACKLFSGSLRLARIV